MPKRDPEFRQLVLFSSADNKACVMTAAINKDKPLGDLLHDVVSPLGN